MQSEVNCWFCNREEHGVSAPLRVKFAKFEEGIPVPRCRRCRRGHAVQGSLSFVGLVISLPFILLAYKLQGGDAGIQLFSAALIVGGAGVGIGFLLGRLFTLGTKPKRHAAEYPLVTQGKSSWGDPIITFWDQL